MKAFIKILILLTVLAGLWLLWQLKINKEAHTNNKPNAVSLETDKRPESTPLAVTKHTETKPILIDQTAQNDSVKPFGESTSTWLNIYRMIRDLPSCKRMMEGFWADKDYNPVQRIIDNVQQLQGETSGMPTALQRKLSNQHFKQCKNLLRRIEILLESHELILPSENDSVYAKYQYFETQLDEILSKTEPVSVKEQRLSDVLKTKLNWQDAFDEVLEASEGEDVTSPEAAALKAELAAIEQRMQALRQQTNDSDPDEELFQELAELNLLSHDMKIKITNLKQVGVKFRAKKIAEFSVLNDVMFNYLKTSDADVFFEAHITLEPQRIIRRQYFGYMPFKDIGTGKVKAPFVEYVSPGDVIKELTGIYDNNTLGLVIDYATQLYWCDLGADCGPNNIWIEMYCFNSHGLFNADSCGLDLRTFYQQHLLNANQWDDVQWMLSIIRDLYAY